jgi:hypothetical protein
MILIQEIPARNGPSHIRVTTATGRCRASCDLATRTTIYRRPSVLHLPSPGPEWARGPAPRHGDGARNGAAAAAGSLGTRPNTALSPLGPGGGLSRTWQAGPRPRRPRQARQSSSQSHAVVATCTVAARSAGPPSRPVRGPPTGRAQRHAQDTTAPALPPTW